MKQASLILWDNITISSVFKKQRNHAFNSFVYGSGLLYDHVLEKEVFILLSAHVEILLLPADSCKHDTWVGCLVRFKPELRCFKQTLKSSLVSDMSSVK